jgi:hypothetical protein
MSILDKTNGAVLWSGIVAPTFVGTGAGVCPQAARRRVDGGVVPSTQHSFLSVAGTATGMGHRSWSPPIT